jgi:hypothetical protein
MSIQLKDFESKIRKYHLLPEAIVIDCKPVGYPFYVLNLDVTYLANRDLELLEEFVMKSIKNGLNKLGEISGFLGIDTHLIEKVLSGLISKNLIKKEAYFMLTQEGLDALQQQTVLALESDSKTFYLDALNGKLIDSFSPIKFDTKKHQNSSIAKIIKKPRKDHIEDIIDYYEDIEKSLQQRGKKPNIELIQVNKIEKVYVDWHEILLVLYRRNPDDPEIEYEIFSRDSIQTEYRETIERLYAEGKKILDPIFQDMKQDNIVNESFSEIITSINNEDVKNVEQISAKISSLNSTLSDSDSLLETKSNPVKEEKQKLEQQLKQIKTQTRISEVIHTYEIRQYLLKALKEAKNRVMIVSPWIKSNVVNEEFISALEATLKRKVQVHIIYGIKGSNFQNDNSSIYKLENLMNNYSNLTFEKTENSHRKQIVCDDKFAIVTSFNFLSFRADPNLTYRDELGVVLRDKQTIEESFMSGLNLIVSQDQDFSKV